MSRETDSPSSGPNGRGGAAYPSGTPPYGTPAATDGGADAGRSAAQPEERKTETTLTTRIRINIPGSRPIPPVVVRKPVADADTADEPTAESAPAPAPGGADTPPPAPAAQGEDKTSDWFAPRRAGQQKPGQGGGANGATQGGGSAPRVASAGPAPTGPRPTTGGPRPPAGGTGLSGATGGPVAPGHGGGTGSFDVTEALTAGHRATADRPGDGTTGTTGNGAGAGTPGHHGGGPAPYYPDHGQGGSAFPDHSQGGNSFSANGFAEGAFPDSGPPNGQTPQNGPGPYPGQGTPPGAPGAPGGHTGGPQGYGGTLQGPAGPTGPSGPTGPTGGPVTGDGPVVPPLGAGGISSGPGVPGGSGANGVPGLPGGPGVPGGSGTSGVSTTPGSGTHPQAGLVPGGGLSDDTAILTPQKHLPGHPGGHHPPENVSGDTVSSGIPVVPPADRGGAPGPSFAPGAGRTDGPQSPPQRTEPAQQSAPAAAPRKKKGRSKLVLLAGGIVVIAGVAYGAGLLMNHSDVPKGTTVLGVDIGGGTRDDAVKKLDAALGKRVGAPLKLSVDGETVSLKPDQAGLQFDADATVSSAAQSDYNPVSVIGSLFGEKRVVEPVMPVDEEKLHSALESAAGDTGAAGDGTITFESGKAVATYGKKGKGIDTAGATDAIEEAYRTQVETGTSGAVRLPTTSKEPTVPDAEVDRMMKEFAEPAMSASVFVQTDPSNRIEFSPENSLWKFLKIKTVDGKLVDSYDEAALQELYGGNFDGVLITRGTGEKTPVTVQDVISALRPALKSTTDRVAIIETNPS
ncbi:hypothetical protein [Streptomyces sp. NPDC088789]|uniref:hypothetical protein n=1 Tax=Streptomyces sp. NPDC088789 TaxID=3365899 RepID=UPI00380FD0AA